MQMRASRVSDLRRRQHRSVLSEEADRREGCGGRAYGGYRMSVLSRPSQPVTMMAVTVQSPVQRLRRLR